MNPGKNEPLKNTRVSRMTHVVRDVRVKACYYCIFIMRNLYHNSSFYLPDKQYELQSVCIQEILISHVQLI